MIKALKLFAKNHKQLEKAHDPDKGIHRKVQSVDARASLKNDPASTFEKCGGQIAKGPRFVNQLVEDELSLYKKEVEDKFKTSRMNNTYIFPRKSVPPSRTGPERSRERDQNSFKASSSIRTDITINMFHQKPQQKQERKPDSLKMDIPPRLVQSFMTSPANNPLKHPKEEVRLNNFVNAEVGCSNQINIFNVYNQSASNSASQKKRPAKINQSYATQMASPVLSNDPS